MKDNITVDKAKFNQFLQLIELKGDITNREAILSITPTSMQVLAVSPNKTVALKGELKGDFKLNKQIGIDELDLLKNLANTFTDEKIQLEIKENKLLLTSKKDKLKVSSILRDPKYITNIIEPEKLESLLKQAKGNNIVLEKEVIDKILQYTTAINADALVLKGDKKKITLELESNQNKIVAEFNTKKDFKPFEVKFAKIFVDLFSVINTDVTISVNKDAPVYLNLKEKDLEFEYVIAPIK